MSERNIEQELIDSIKEIKSGHSGRRFTVEVPLDIKTLREELGLSQRDFSNSLGVSNRTLQEWEQGRRHPTGPALALLKIADKYPFIFSRE